ncbi:MAG TPA: beta-phosphoglucomutase family hydrolase, partial [Sandaracinaceae bacterium]
MTEAAPEARPSSTGQGVSLSPRDYDAVLFDLDGVLTRTASVHAAAWKELFDAFLAHHAERTGTPFVPFDIEADYRRYVDGRPRHDGVQAFLASRGIELPIGTADDPAGEDTVHALGTLKDRYFLRQLAEQGVQVFESSIALVRELRAQDVRTGVVSSSTHCAAILAAAGIAELFDVRVDGADIVRLGLKGKPAPDAFLEAARRLRVEAARTVVIEDAVAGVAAARAGRFGSVIGVDRHGQAQALHDAGADVVVSDLAQVCVAVEPPAAWALVYEHYDPREEGIRESLCALGNGYFTTRGALAWARADGSHYPGTYLAGGYNRMRSDIGVGTVENEDLVNLPNWLVLELRLGDGPWLDLRQVAILEYRQELDLRRGMLLRRVRFEDAEGRRTLVCERRLVSMADMHLAAIELSIGAENWSGPVTVRSAIDGQVVNAGVRVYERFANRHLVPLDGGAIDPESLFLLVRTTQSRLHVAEAIRTQIFRGTERIEPPRRLREEDGYVAHEIALALEAGTTLTVEKIACLFSSRDPAISEPVDAAAKAIRRAGRFEALAAAHALAWRHLWRRFDMHMQPARARFELNVPMLTRLNLLHLLQAVSPHTMDLDVGVPARGWTGEHYHGHVFWDELFIFPSLNFRMPEITRSLLLYRYRRLPEARAAARAAGRRGAMFPWQSGSDGQEETQAFNFNFRSGRWIRDNSYLQRHVGSAIAYNVWQYFQVTNDVEFLHFYGAELILDIALFWSSMATWNPARGRYEIRGVMGPDEFHEAYPGAEKPGLDNNAYTNVMAVWVLCRALDVFECLSDMRRSELMARLGIGDDDIRRWDHISRRMFVPFHEDGIISQFEGYEALAELDWDRYRARYGNIQRLDLILEAENDSANRYKVAKQPDVLM